MRNNNSENPNEKIEFILSSLIDFSNNNEFDYSLYKSFAEDSSKSFIRYFSKIDNEKDRNKIISEIHTDLHFTVEDVVTNMLASNQNNGSVSEDEIYISQPIPDNRIRSYESNYMKLKESFLNLVLTEIKPQESKTIEAEKVEIKPQETTTPKPDETEENKHPKHDPNYWNKECFELFKYLYNESYKGKIRQITNIWFYLNEFERNSINKKYILNCTKDRYKDFIEKNYHITIKNFDKSTTNYEEKVYPKLNEHRQMFEDSLKQIAENVKNT